MRFLVLIAALFLGACASSDGVTLQQERELTVAKIELGYSVLELAVSTYCAPSVGTFCSTPSAQAEIAKAKAVARPALDAIVKNILAAGSLSSIYSYLTAATDVLKVLGAALQIYGVPGTG